MVKFSVMLKVITKAFNAIKIWQKFVGTIKKLTPSVGRALSPRQLDIPKLV